MSNETMFAESQVNKMLEDQRIILRLDGLETVVEKLATSMQDHIITEKKDSAQVMEAVTQSSNDRRKCETDIRHELKVMDTNHYDVFVQKSQLRIYAFLVVFSVTTAAAIIGWLGSESNKSAQREVQKELVKSITELLKSK